MQASRFQRPKDAILGSAVILQSTIVHSLCMAHSLIRESLVDLDLLGHMVFVSPASLCAISYSAGGLTSASSMM